MEEGEGLSARTQLALAIGGVTLSGAYALYQASIGRTYRAWSVVAVLLGIAIVAVLVRVPRTRWLVPAVIPILVAAAMGTFFWGTRAAFPAAIGVVLLGLLAAGVDVERGLGVVFGALVRGITAGLGWLAFSLTIFPAWLWTRLRRRDPVASDAEPGSMWIPVERGAALAAPTALGAGGPRHEERRSFVGKVTWAVGCVCLLLGVNYGLGWAWNRAEVERSEDPEATLAEQRYQGEVLQDPRADLPAMAAYPWRDRYFEDIQRTVGGYWPFTEYRPADFTSPYVNQDDWVRKSYEPAADDGDLPVAWMFGGSTTWGEGQRDEWTIASWLARISEAEGIPLQVRNYGQRGWTHFQEMILYEQRLDLEENPDLAIFYDGANEITAQSLLTERVPTHTLTYGFANKLYGTTVATELVEQPDNDTLATDLWVQYRENSAVHLLAEALRSDPAGASPAQGDADGIGEGIDADQQEGQNGNVFEYDLNEQDGTDAGQVYERGKRFTMLVSEEQDVEDFYFWQPMRYRTPPIERAIEEISEPTVDISRALEDHDDVYIDGGHTNEEGARLVAEAIWPTIEPTVRAWYEENR